MNNSRRHFLAHGAAGLSLLGGFSSFARASLDKAQILVIGGGFGGATVAKYLRLFSNNTANVILIEPNANFLSCPMSNFVVAGMRSMADITSPYDSLTKHHGIKLIRDSVSAIDPDKKTVKLSSGSVIGYDKVVLSPGISLMTNSIEGLAKANQAGVTLQAWKAGPETLMLYKQLAAMPDGGVFAISIPEAPYRCPPGPYERASLVANYLKQHKPKSKVLILDANQDITSKGALFKKAWSAQYSGLIEYLPSYNVTGVDAKTKTLRFEVQDDVRADVLNVLPAMSAGEIAIKTGLANANGRWVNVDFLNFEATATRDIHVLGDAIQTAPLMPKSGHMANQHAKVAAAAIIAQLNDWPINPAPVVNNTCYSFVSEQAAVHIASVHQYDAQAKTFKSVPGAGGLSSEPSNTEASYAWGWAHNIWADTLA
jgi:NADH dehydrogenase FAD-containing subunit